MSQSLNIVFMGTPEFAVASLHALAESKHKVIAAVTSPDKPANRGLKLQMSAVKEYAQKNNLKILQPEKLKSEPFIAELKALNPDLIIVVAFRMLPEVIWSLPHCGTVNLHASLLPQYRGAAPINWAIINGEKETGVTTFFISHEIDTGDILMQKKIPVAETDDAGIIYTKLMMQGAALLVETVDAIANNNTKPVKQNTNASIKPAPKIFRETCKINWNRPAHEIYNHIRGLSPYPGAWTEFTGSNGKKTSIKIYKTGIENTIQVNTSSVLVADKKRLFIGCNSGVIEVLEMQPEGKKRMTAQEFLHGIPPKNQLWNIAY